MVVNCSEYISNLSIPSTNGYITVEEALGIANYQYMRIMAFFVILLCLYVFYTNFIINTRFDVFQKYKLKIFDVDILPIDVHELAILPAIGLLIVSLAFFGVI